MNKILIERDREGWYGIGPGHYCLYNYESGVFLLPHHIIFTVPATKFLLLSCVIGSHMTIYVMLGNLKSSAFEKFDSIEERDQKAKKIIESLGGNMLSLFYTFGQYDFVAIIDMPTKESLVKFLAIVAKFGTVRTETLETISPDTFYKISQEI
jgi:uncharacterized protein with GYD domain